MISLSMLDKLIDENNMQKSKVKFYKTVEKVKKHLAMIFHRFIEEDNLQIYVNKNLLEAWNPFIRQNPATMELACEELFDGKQVFQLSHIYFLIKRNLRMRRHSKRQEELKIGWLIRGFMYTETEDL